MSERGVGEHEDKEGHLLWEPSEEQRRDTNLDRYRRWLGARVTESFATYDDLWRWSVQDLEGYWASIWDYYDIMSEHPYTEVLPERRMPGASWFPGATLNFAAHVLRHEGDGVALIFADESGHHEEISRDQLRRDVGALAQTLRAAGVERGDRVVAYLPNIPHAVVGLLAAASLGAIWSSCSPDFGARSVIDRLEQISPKVLIAADGYHYGGQAYDRTGVVDELRSSLSSLELTISVPCLDPDWAPADTMDWSNAIAEPAELRFEMVPFEHPLWVLYSSGTTGAPKGIVHGHGGILLGLVATLSLHLDLGADDRFLWFTTTGWVMWNINVATLMLGATAILYDGSPGHPGTDRLWEVAAETGATVLGMSAGYIGACSKAELSPGSEHDLSCLRALSFTGSPLAPKEYGWVYKHVAEDLWFSSISGGTDVCVAFVGGNPMLPVHAGELQCRALGVNVQAFNEAGTPLIDHVGELVITEPMPSMPIYLWGDDDGSRYHESYFDTYPGVWRHGDWIKITSRGTAVIVGRSDATINRMGVRMGSAEIYQAVERLPEIVDSLTIDLTYQNRESILPLFVVLRDGEQLDDELVARIKAEVRSNASPRHVPDPIIQVPGVPRTLNNKKLEVPIRKILLGMDPGAAINRDAMSNPEVLDTYIYLANTRFASDS